MNNDTTLGYISSALAGAGIAQLSADFNQSLILVGIAVALIVTKAVLNKYGVPISGKYK